ncbi:MAG: Sec-independent protein translocase protein TatB [Bdellovibrionales bacterium]
MFNFGFSEMLIIAVVALIFIGPKQLPHLARVLGRTFGELRRASSDFHREIYNADSKFKNSVSDFENQMEEKLTVKIDEEIARRKFTEDTEKLVANDKAESEDKT